MADNHFLVERNERIATISINRPDKKNAMNREMWAQLAGIVDELGADRNVFVIVIRGAGREVFCAGADISEFDRGESPEVRARANEAGIDRCLHSIKDCPKAVIAMVYGYAMGGGCALALSCDLRIAAKSAKFGIPAAKLGGVYAPPLIGSLASAVGPSNAALIMFTAASFDAETSRQMGIVTAVYPDEQLEDQVYRLAGRIAQNAPLSVAGSKKIIQAFMRDPTFEHDPEVFELNIQAFGSQDHKEGVRAFHEKRKPVFRGV